jgi:hypothetical protein
VGEDIAKAVLQFEWTVTITIAVIDVRVAKWMGWIDGGYLEWRSCDGEERDNKTNASCRNLATGDRVKCNAIHS